MKKFSKQYQQIGEILFLCIYSFGAMAGAESSKTWNGQVGRLLKDFPVSKSDYIFHANPMGEVGTEVIARSLNLKGGERVLDLCAGWAGPSIYLAENIGKKKPITVEAIEVNELNCEKAKENVKKASLGQSKVNIHCHSISHLPFETESFDAVMGVDPDGVAYVEDRMALFRELFRVLKSGKSLTFKHWVPNLRESDRIKKEFDALNSWEGVSPRGVNADTYSEQLKIAGFSVEVKNMSIQYHNATNKIIKRMQERVARESEQGFDSKVDPWVLKYIELDRESEVGFGVLIKATKPISDKK